MSAAVAERQVVSAGVVRFLASNLEQILARHCGAISPQATRELELLLEAFEELRSVRRG